MTARLHSRRIASLGLLAASMAACGPQPAPLTGVQQLRSGNTADGGHGVGFDVFAADGQTAAAMRCDEDALSVTVFVSSDGEVYTPLSDEDVQVQCGSAARTEVAIVVDNSGSEDGFLGDLQRAATDLATAVIDNGGQASLVRVSTRAHVMQPLTDDGPAINGMIADTWITNGWTALWDGARVAAETLETSIDPALQAEDDGDLCATSVRRAIALYTDGVDNNSADQYPCDSCLTEADGIDTRPSDIANLEVGGTTPPVYAIGVGSYIDVDGLTELGERTGGGFLHLVSHQELLDALPNLAGHDAETARVCFDVPDAECGPLWVRIQYRWTDGGEAVVHESEHQTYVCPEPPSCEFSAPDHEISLIGLEGVHVKGTARVLGGTQAVVRSNGDVLVQGDAIVEADVHAGRDVVVTGAAATVNGNIVEGAAPVELLSADDAVAAARTENDNASLPLTSAGRSALTGDGALTVRSNDTLVVSAGDYYFSGIAIAGGARIVADGPVRFFVDGSVSMAGHSETSGGDPANFVVVSSGEQVLKFTGTSAAQLMVYAPDAPVLVEGTQVLQGSIAAEFVTVRGTGTVGLDPGAGDVCPLR